MNSTPSSPTTAQVERLAVEEVPSRSRSTAPKAIEPTPFRVVETPPPPPPQTFEEPAAFTKVAVDFSAPPRPRMARRAEPILDVFQAIGKVLAVRFFLLLAVCFSFALAWRAIDLQSNASLAVLISFAVLTVGPLTYLEWAGRPRLPQ